MRGDTLVGREAAFSGLVYCVLLKGGLFGCGEEPAILSLIFP
jgi:hypothetical protein